MAGRNGTTQRGWTWVPQHCGIVEPESSQRQPQHSAVPFIGAKRKPLHDGLDLTHDEGRLICHCVYRVCPRRRKSLKTINARAVRANARQGRNPLTGSFLHACTPAHLTLIAGTLAPFSRFRTRTSKTAHPAVRLTPTLHAPDLLEGLYASAVVVRKQGTQASHTFTPRSTLSRNHQHAQRAVRTLAFWYKHSLATLSQHAECLFPSNVCDCPFLLLRCLACELHEHLDRGRDKHTCCKNIEENWIPGEKEANHKNYACHTKRCSDPGNDYFGFLHQHQRKPPLLIDGLYPFILSCSASILCLQISSAWISPLQKRFPIYLICTPRCVSLCRCCLPFSLLEYETSQARNEKDQSYGATWQNNAAKRNTQTVVICVQRNTHNNQHYQVQEDCYIHQLVCMFLQERQHKKTPQLIDELYLLIFSRLFAMHKMYSRTTNTVTRGALYTFLVCLTCLSFVGHISGHGSLPNNQFCLHARRYAYA